MADVVQRVNEIRRAIDAVATGPVDIMAVTKRHTPDEINPLAESEIIRIGENRVQEFMEKRDVCGTDKRQYRAVHQGHDGRR